MNKKKLNTKTIVMIAMLGAISAILMFLDFNVPLAPGFIKFDFSDLPVLIGGFLFGPVLGTLVAALKIILVLIFKPTTTMFVGELSNFILSVCFMTISCTIYRRHKTRKEAAIGMAVSTVATSLLAIVSNIFLIFPLYAAMFNMSIAQIVKIAMATNPWVTDLTSMVIFSLLPFNLFKYGVISIITFLIYKKISIILKKHIQ